MPKISRYLAAQLSRNNTVAHGGVGCHTYKSGESFLSLRKLQISRNSAAMGRESLQSQFATSCSMLICERSAKKIQKFPNGAQRLITSQNYSMWPQNSQTVREHVVRDPGMSSVKNHILTHNGQFFKAHLTMSFRLTSRLKCPSPIHSILFPNIPLQNKFINYLR